MIQVMQAHPISIVVVVFTLLITPYYWFLLLPRDKAITMVWIMAVIAAIMLTLNLFDFTGQSENRIVLI